MSCPKLPRSPILEDQIACSHAGDRSGVQHGVGRVDSSTPLNAGDDMFAVIGLAG